MRMDALDSLCGRADLNAGRVGFRDRNSHTVPIPDVKGKITFIVNFLIF